MRRSIVWIVTLALGLGLIFYSIVLRDESGVSSSLPGGQTPTPDLGTTPEVTLITTPVSTGKPIIGQTPATCQISGKIRFWKDDLYETIGAKIVYQNVDDRIRQIYWKSNPDDGALRVGPNLFEELILPTGEKSVGVALNKKVYAPLYTLTAAITYGLKRPDGAVDEKVANCTGNIIVTLP